MTLCRFALVALIGSLSLASVASAQMYGPAYGPANRIEDIAHELHEGYPSHLHGSRFVGALAGLSRTIENEAQDILRLSRKPGNLTGAIVANANSIRRLVLRSNELLNQVELDLRMGRGHVHTSPRVPRRMLAEIDRLAAQIVHDVTYGPFGQPGFPVGGTVIHRHTTNFGGNFGGYYDDRFVRPAVQPTLPGPNQGGLWVGGLNLGQLFRW